MLEVMEDDIGRQIEDLLPETDPYLYFRQDSRRAATLESSITERRGASKDFLLCTEAKARQLNLMS